MTEMNIGKIVSFLAIIFGLFFSSISLGRAKEDHCPEEKKFRCEFGQWHTEIEFYPVSFQGLYGYINNEAWHVPTSEGFRAGCAVETPSLELIGAGSVSGTINYSGSFQDWINSPSVFNQLFLFELMLSYVDHNNKRYRKRELIAVQELGHLHLIGSDYVLGDFYFSTSAGELRQRTILLDVPQDAMQVKLSVCSIFPGANLHIQSLQIGTYSY